MNTLTINELWHSEDEEVWASALKFYWHYVKDDLRQIEEEMDVLDVETIQKMNPQQWYEFLLEKYFRWKYTAWNRYRSTTKHLKRYVEEDTLTELYQIKQEIFTFDKTNARQGLEIACRIRGLGTAGASGLLGVMFPKHFGTVDQFAVKALRGVNGLGYDEQLKSMNPVSLKIGEGVILVEIMRKKADDLNRKFQTDTWTTRKVDMILWTYGRESGERRGEVTNRKRASMERFVWKEGDIEIIKP